MPSKGDKLKNAIWGKGWSMEFAADKLEKSRTWLYGLFKLSDEKFDPATVQYVKSKTGIDLDADEDVKIPQLEYAGNNHGLTDSGKNYNIPDLGAVRRRDLPLYNFTPVLEPTNVDSYNDSDDENEKVSYVEFYYSLPDLPGNDFIMIMASDHMEPEIRVGEKVLVRKQDKNWMSWGDPHLIRSKDGVKPPMIRYIDKSPKKDHWIIRPCNPKYGSEEIHRDKVKDVYLVMAHGMRKSFG